MYSSKSKGSKYLSFFLALLMVFSLFAPLTGQTRVAAAEAGTALAKDQIITLPVEKEQSSGNTGAIKAAAKGFSSMENTRHTVTQTVYGAVYENWTLNFGFNSEFRFAYPNDVPVMVTVSGSVYGLKDNWSYKVVLEKDTSTTYTVGPENTDKYKTMDMYGEKYILAYFPNNMVPGAYKLKVEGYSNGQKAFTTESRDVDILTYTMQNAKYLSTRQTIFQIPLEGVGANDIPDNSNSVDAEIIDENGNILAITNSEFRNSGFSYFDSGLWPFSDEKYQIAAMTLVLLKADSIQPGKYKIRLKINGHMVELGKYAQVNFTDGPILSYIGLPSTWEKPIIAGDRGFDINVDAVNLPNKEILKFSLLDNQGNAIATSDKSSYRYYVPTGEVSLSYHMSVLPDKQLIDNVVYSIQATYSGEGTLVSNVQKAYMTTVTEAKITGIDTQYAQDGKLVISTVNLQPGTQCAVDIYLQVNNSFSLSSTAVVDTDGKLTFIFKNSNGSPMPIPLGDYSLRLTRGQNWVDGWMISIGGGGFSKTFIDHVSPKFIPQNTGSFHAVIGIYGIYPDKSVLGVKLVEAGNYGNIVGEVKPENLKLIDKGYGSYSLEGQMDITGALQSGKIYCYKVISKDANLINESYAVKVTDEFMATEIYLQGQVDGISIGDGNNFPILPANVSELTFSLPSVINAEDSTKVSFELVDAQGNTAASIVDGTLESKADGVFKAFKGKLKAVKPLLEGVHYFQVKYDTKTIKIPYTVTSKPGFLWETVSRYIPVSSTRLKVAIQEAFNLDFSKLAFQIKDTKGNVVENEIDKNSIVYINEKEARSVNFEVVLKTPLKETAYQYEIKQDGIKLLSSKDYSKERLFYAVKYPTVTGLYWKYGNDGKIAEYGLKGINLSSGKNYKASFYWPKDQRDYYSSASVYEKTLPLGKPNTVGDLVISAADVSTLPSGIHMVYIEEDGRIIGFQILSIDGSGVTVAKPPKITINQGGFYTNNREVTLNILAEGYQLMRIASSKEELPNAAYVVINSSANWRLPEGDGEKTVFAQFKDIDGKESEIISAKVLLDTLQPTKPVIVRPAANVTIEEGSFLKVEATAKERVKVYAEFFNANGSKVGNMTLGYIATESSGDFRFGNGIWMSDALANTKQIKVYLEDFAGNKSPVSEPINIQVAKLVQISGVLKAGAENIPYQYVELRKGDKYFAGTNTDMNGRFTFWKVPNGTYQLFAYGTRGFRDTFKEVIVDGSNITDIELALQDKYSGRGTITVTAERAPNTWVNISNWQESLYYSSALDQQGKAVLANVPVGVDFSVSIYYKGYYKQETVRLGSNGANVDIIFPIPEYDTIKGKVTKEGTGVSGVSVNARSSTGNYTWTSTKGDGTYTFDLPKDDKYTVAIDTGVAGIPIKAKYEDVVTGSTDINFTLGDGFKVEGNVKDTAGKNIPGARVYSSGGANWEYHNAVGKEDGSYSFGYVFGPGRHTLSVWVPGYYSVVKTIDITEEQVEKKLGSIVDFVLTPEGASNIFTNPDHNGVKTNVDVTQRGKDITVKVRYHNASSTVLQNVRIDVAVPEGTTVISQSLPQGAAVNATTLSKTIAKINENGILDESDRGEFSFMLKVNENFAGNSVLISASANYNNSTATIGFAEVAVVGATLNAPNEIGIAASGTESKPFKVYGEATKGAKVAIVNADTDEVLVTTEPIGKWYSATIQLPAPTGGATKKVYNLVAKATSGDVAGSSAIATVTVKSGAVEVGDIELKSDNGQSVGRNRDTGIAAFSVWANMQLIGRPVEAKVQLLNTVSGDTVEYEFLGKKYPAAYQSGYWTATISDWKGSGIQKLKIRVWKDNSWIEFIIGELTILIDPSGYVYDEYTGDRIQGATVTCEVLRNDGTWAKWDAESHGQVNPQITNPEGKYGWMVPNGTYRVIVHKQGYEDYATTIDPKYSLNNQSTIVIPPPRDDVNIGLISIAQPEVLRHSPSVGEEVSTDAIVKVTFNKAMDTSTITSSSLVVTDKAGKAVDGTISFSDKDTVVVFTPTAPLTNGEEYTVSLQNTIKDKVDRSSQQRTLGGNTAGGMQAQSTEYSFTFVANAGAPAATYLNVQSVQPVNNAQDVPVNTTVSVTFDKELAASTVTKDAFKVSQSNVSVPGVLRLSEDKKTVTFTPNQALVSGTNCTIEIDLTLKSVDGESLREKAVYTFRTINNTDDNGDSGNHDGNNDIPGGGNSGYSLPEATPEPATEPTPAPIPEQKDTKAEVKPVEGGTLEIKDKVKMVVPPFALKGTAEIKVSPVTDVSAILPQEDAMKLAGEVFEFTTTGERTFLQPITLTFKYDTSKAADASKLAVYYYNEGRKQWIYMGGEVNPADGTITAATKHFTKFAVFTTNTKVKLADVDTHWSKEYIKKLVGMGIVSGMEKGDGTTVYMAESNVTREQFAKFVVMALNLDITGPVSLQFKDADKIQEWAKPYVAAAVKAGIIQGIDDGNGGLVFNPDKNITRAEMAAMVSRGLKLKASNTEIIFADNDAIPAWAVDHIKVAVDQGIISGYEDNTFRPAKNATRGEAAKIIVMMLEALGI